MKIKISYKKGIKNILNYFLRIADGIKLTQYAWASPIYLQIEPVSGICNLSCRICDSQSMEKKELSFEEFKKILDSFPFCMELKLTGNGESFMAKDFFKMLEYAKSKNIKVSFYTNMTLMDEEKAKRLVELKVDEVFISIDSSQPILFEKIRRGADYKAVIGNIERLNRLKREYGSKCPELYFGVVALRENIEDIPDLVRLASGLMIKGVVVHHLGIKDAELAVPRQDLKNALPYALHYFREAERIAKENRLHFSYPSFDLEKEGRFSLCQLPWINCQIDPWGNIYPCCRLRKSFGNIFKEGLSVIWNGHNYRRLRKLAAAKRLPCPQCETNMLSFSSQYHATRHRPKHP